MIGGNLDAFFAAHRAAELRDAKLYNTLAAARPTCPALSVSHSWMKVRASLDGVMQFCADAFAAEFGGICCRFGQQKHRQSDSMRFHPSRGGVIVRPSLLYDWCEVMRTH